VTQVVKSDMRQLCTPQEGREGPLPEIGGVDEFTAFARKHKVLILVETTRFQLLSSACRARWLLRLLWPSE
jgi:hypothetical protein